MSPIMARPKDDRRVSKEQLALAVKKDSNAVMIHEQEIITSFLYAVDNRGKVSETNGQIGMKRLDAVLTNPLFIDKYLKMRFEAGSGK